MYQFFTAKVGKVIEIKGGKKPAAVLQLDLAKEQDSKPPVLSTLVQAVRTQGESKGQLLPFKDGLSAHLVLDIAFVRRLQPGHLLRVEWETRSGGIMTNILALVRNQ
jgi:hypothetical protein